MLFLQFEACRCLHTISCLNINRHVCTETWRGYFKQAREELGMRLVEFCYTEEGSLNKYWMAFSNRKFLNKAL